MAAGQIYKGHNVRFSYNGKTLYHTTSCNWSTSRDFEEIATKDTDGTMSIESNYKWEMTTNALVADKPVASTDLDFMDIMDLYLNATEIDVEFTSGVVGDWVLGGKVKVSSCSIAAEEGSVVKGDFAFKGIGDITKTVVPA